MGTTTLARITTAERGMVRKGKRELALLNTAARAPSLTPERRHSPFRSLLPAHRCFEHHRFHIAPNDIGKAVSCEKADLVTETPNTWNCIRVKIARRLGSALPDSGPAKGERSC